MDGWFDGPKGLFLRAVGADDQFQCISKDIYLCVRKDEKYWYDFKFVHLKLYMI